MLKPSMKGLQGGLLVGLFCGLAADVPAVNRDATEIFFGPQTLLQGNSTPNILLALDTSGSMQIPIPGQGQTRFQALKSATRRLLNGMHNVNVGLMRFTCPGGPILYPVTNIDGPSLDLISQNVTVAVSGPDDDAEEGTSAAAPTVTTNPTWFPGNVELHGRVLSLGNTSRIETFAPQSDEEFDFLDGSIESAGGVQWNVNDDQRNGVRYTGLGSRLTPADLARIASVTLRFTAARDESGGSGVLHFQGERNANSPPFDGSTPFVPALRPLTDRLVPWPSPPAFVNLQTYHPPELLPLFEEITSTPGWNLSSSPLTLYAFTSPTALTSVGGGEAYARGASIERSPRRMGGNPVANHITLQVGVAANQNVGLRFSALDIPKGARIRAARLVFTAAPHPHTDGRRLPVLPDALVNPIAMSTPVTLSIHGEATTNPCRFSATGTPPPSAAEGCTPALTSPGRVSTRPLTAASLPDWQVPAFTPDLTYSSPDISPIVQELVNQDGFCGGNAIALQLRHVAGNGQRMVYSGEDGSRAPRLEVEFDTSTLESVPDAGCLIRTVTARAAQSVDDVWSQSDRSNLTGSLLLSSQNTFWSGIRFRSVNIPQGARVLEASLTMRATGTNMGAPELRIWGHNVDQPVTFTTSQTTVSARPRTPSTQTLTLNSNNSQYRITGLGPMVQEIVNRTGWRQGNALALLFENRTRASNTRIEVHSTDTRVTDAPLLTVRLDLSEVTSGRTNRDEMLAAVEELTAEGWTPLVGTQLEAARYLHGLGVLHGRGLGHTNPTLKSLSHPMSYAGGTRVPANCGSSAGQTACTSITGNAVYRSPITDECSPNHFVLLTDGEANHNHMENSTDHGRSHAQDLVGANCVTTISNPDGQGPGVILTRNLGTNPNELCGRDIAHRLANPPPASGGGPLNPANQQIITHTVAFNLDPGVGHQFLQDVAANGKGRYHSANTADELLAVFNEIIEDIDNQPTSFTAPATSVNTFNRLRNLDDVYFSMFEPSLKSAWRGNIKRFRVEGEQIVGVDGRPAVDQVTGEFLDSARSFWDVDGQPDGRKLQAGGAAEAQMPLSPNMRNVYTYLGSYADVATSRAGIPLDLLPTGVGGLSPEQRARYAELVGLADADPALPNLYDWIRGRDVDDENGNGSTNDMRYTFGSPLHASPVVVTLGGSEQAPVQMVVAASNDGALRWIDAATGRELGVFIPPEQLAIQATRRANANGRHIYGLDATPSVWVLDTEPFGVIEPSRGDFVRVIFGERDGGDRYYAVDLTPATDLRRETTPAQLATIPFQPKFLWKIDGSPSPADLAPGQTGLEFADLGLSWSEPLVRRVRFANEPSSRTVVIFGGGNDQRFDRAFIDLPSAASVQAFAPKGNIVYIVDATTGERLTAIGGPNTNADLRVEGMHHPIPSTIAAMSSTGLREIDRLYFGDLGGKVWRVDLNPGITRAATGGAVATVGLLASVSRPQTAAEAQLHTEAGDSGAHGRDTRKFYNIPAIVRQQDSVFSAAPRHTLVLLGSGSRANPLNLVTEDHFYALRDLRERPFEPTANGLAVGYPERQQSDPANPNLATGPIGGQGGDFAGELVDVTANPLQSVVNGQVPVRDSPEAAAMVEIRESLGWFIRMPALQTVDGLSHLGEKVLNPATVGLGTLFFTAFTPASFDDIAANCRAEVGITRIYGLNLSTGAANIGDFGDPPALPGGPGAGTGDANVVLDGNDRSTRNPLRGNPGGTTLLNTDTLKSITGTRVIDIGTMAPVPTYWFQRQ
jgi:type IV pilus assembly protein PilY1